MHRSTARGLTIALLACNAVLVGVILTEIRMGPPAVGSAAPMTPAAIADVTSLGTTLFAHPPLEEFREVVERPAFDQTRRPFEPPPPPDPAAQAAQPAAATPPPRLALIGIVVTADNRAALLWDELKRESIRASVGMSVAGWELAEVTLEGVTLRQGQRDHRIELLDKENQRSGYLNYQRSRGQVSQK